MTGDFIPGSSSIGILLVVYSADDESNNTMTNYHFMHRSNIRRTIAMTNLPSGQHEVSVFVVEGNGLPFNRSATTPRNLSLTERKLHTYNTLSPFPTLAQCYHAQRGREGFYGMFSNVESYN